MLSTKKEKFVFDGKNKRKKKTTDISVALLALRGP